MATKKKPASPPEGSWTFFTNHGHVLVCIAQNPDIRISDIADLVGIGERAAHRIVGELVDGGYVIRTKDGRRNTYTVDYSQHLRHPLEAGHTIGEIFKALVRMKSGAKS
jgi:DNA-binding MarR family transcriptional regulator